MTREVAGTQPASAPKHVSRRNNGGVAVAGKEFRDWGCTRFVARELKITKRPSGPMAGARLAPLASAPSGPMEMRIVAGTQTDAAAMQVSRRKISLQPLLSPFTRLLASEAKTTNRPSVVTEGELLEPFGSAPFHPTEIGIIRGSHAPLAPRQLSRRKILAMPVPVSMEPSAELATKAWYLEAA